jgi:hypothetical protein
MRTVAPAIAGTWRLAPGRWVDLTEGQKQRLSNYVEGTRYCTYFTEEDKTMSYVMCRLWQTQLENGGQYYPPERVTTKYLARNFYVSAGAFALVFALGMIGPRYVAWLRR